MRSDRRTCDIVRHADLRGDDVERLDKVVVCRVRDAEEQVNHEQHFDRGTNEALLERQEALLDECQLLGRGATTTAIAIAIGCSSSSNATTFSPRCVNDGDSDGGRGDGSMAEWSRSTRRDARHTTRVAARKQQAVASASLLVARCRRPRCCCCCCSLASSLLVLLLARAHAAALLLVVVVVVGAV